MKQSIIGLIACLSLFSLDSCKKDILSGNKELLPPTALSMQILEKEPVIATDTGYFSVLASTSGAKFVKLSVELTPDFEGFMEKTKTEVADSITVDADGTFSQPVSTILIEYPFIATAKIGDILTAKFTFTDEKGGTVSVSASKIVVNYRTFSNQQFFYATRPWYNFATGLTYSKTSIGIDTLKDNLEIFWLRQNGIQYICSPDADETADQFTTVPAYNQNEVHSTKLIKLDGVSFDDVDDATFAAMDFTNAKNVIELEDQSVYGILLQDGRKAALQTILYSASISRVRSKIQVTP